MPKISVIIPVYNAARYLEECITSLLVQTLTSCEFIFVNDGSKDNSQTIIETYQKRDDRIILINQENQGVSEARNTGILRSTGTYLSFVDSDDYVKEDFLEQLYNAVIQNGAKIVISNFSTIKNGIPISIEPPFETNTCYIEPAIKKQVVPFFIERDGMNNVWNKLYDSKFIKENNLFFPVGMTHGEDGLFNIQAFYKASKVFFLDYSGYFYREVVGSATRNVGKHDYLQMALQTFALDYSKYGITLQERDIKLLQSIRLINNLIALMHILLDPSNKKGYRYKVIEIKKIVWHPIVQKAIAEHWEYLIKGKSKYQLSVLYSLKYKFIVGILLVVAYSNYQNK